MNTIVFKGFLERVVFEKDDYKIYAIMPSDLNCEAVKNSYGNVTITGEIQDLDFGVEYIFSVVQDEKQNKYGQSYKIINVRRNKPTSFEATFEFLNNILTFNQAKTLFEAYPDIVDIIMNEKDSEIDLTKTPGIKKKTFDKIKLKVIENFALIDLVEEFKNQVPLSVMKKLYNEYSSIDLIRRKIIEDPYYCFCSLSGIGFKTADAILLTLNEKGIISFGYDLKTSLQRCRASIIYVLDEVENSGNTRIEIVELRNECINIANQCIEHFVDCIKEKEFFYYESVNNDVFVSKMRTYQNEKYICNTIKNELSQNKVCDDTWMFDENEFKIVDGLELTNQQLQALKNVRDYKISLLNGFAGSGKTNTTKAIINAVESKHLSCLLLAPTGKAAKILSSYTNRQAMTIHRALGLGTDNKSDEKNIYKIMADVIIIDEFSMVDIFIGKKLFERINFDKSHVLIIGDSAQIPSVSCGNLLHDLLTSNIIPSVTLDKVFRYKDGGLMKVATDIRNSDKYLETLNGQVTFFGDNKDYAFVNVRQEDIITQCLGLYEKLLETYEPEDIFVLSSYKKGDYGSKELNKKLQRIANKKNINDNKKITSGEREFYYNDLVIQTVNDYHLKQHHGYDDYTFDSAQEDKDIFVANGESGKITRIGHPCIINFDGIEVEYRKENLINIDLSYALTCHKVQGDAAKVVILLTPKAHTYMLNSNLLYVAVTRAREKCFHIGTKEVVDRAVEKRENFQRNTWTKHLLKTNH